MTEKEVMEILINAGAVLTNDHFVLTRWNHSDAYLEKDLVYTNPSATSRLGRAIAERFEGDRVQTVIGPESGGVILSRVVAYWLRWLTDTKISSVPAEKVRHGFNIREMYSTFLIGKRALVVDDVLTTGGTVIQVAEQARNAGADIVGVGIICNRGGLTAEKIGVPKLVTLLNVSLDSWSADECPLCKSNVPVNPSFGRGKEFLAQRQQ